MHGVPGEDLVIMARRLDPNYHQQITDPTWSETVGPTDWRYFVDPDLRAYWGKGDYTMRMFGFVLASRMAERVRRRQREAQTP